MGETVDCESIDNTKFKVKDEMNKFRKLKGKLLACGTC